MGKDNSTDSYKMDDVLSPNFFSVDFYQKRKKGKFRLVPAPSTKYSVADTHCHIEMFDRPEWTFIRASLHNVTFLACVIDSIEDGQEGIDKVEAAFKLAGEMLPNIIEQIKNEGKQASDVVTIKLDESPALCLDVNAICDDPKLPELHYIIGAHPHNAKDWNDDQQLNLRELLKNKRAVCVGEIGLDYHYDLSPRDAQVEVFKQQLNIANELKMPVSLHIREAHDVALDILNEIGFCKYGTLLHCFNLGPEELKPWLDADCFVAFGGPLTFKNTDYTREAAKLVPKDKLLTETDAPFMTPEPLRGDTCFPDHVVWSAKTLCEVTDNYANEQHFYNQLMRNTKNFFRCC